MSFSGGDGGMLYRFKRFTALVVFTFCEKCIICSLVKNSPPDCFLNTRLRIAPSLFGLIKKKDTRNGCLFLAETAGFEPAGDCSLTDFESAPL